MLIRVMFGAVIDRSVERSRLRDGFGVATEVGRRHRRRRIAAGTHPGRRLRPHGRRPLRVARVALVPSHRRAAACMSVQKCYNPAAIACALTHFFHRAAYFPPIFHPLTADFCSFPIWQLHIRMPRLSTDHRARSVAN